MLLSKYPEFPLLTKSWCWLLSSIKTILPHRGAVRHRYGQSLGLTTGRMWMGSQKPFLMLGALWRIRFGYSSDILKFLFWLTNIYLGLRSFMLNVMAFELENLFKKIIFSWENTNFPGEKEGLPIMRKFTVFPSGSGVYLFTSLKKQLII